MTSISSVSLIKETKLADYPTHSVEKEVPRFPNTCNHLIYRQANAGLALAVGFISRIFIERSLFQNSQIPMDTLLYLANDLIRTLTPQKREVISVAQEVSLLWKQLTRQSLTQDEKNYLEGPKEIDVMEEVFNGLKYSSAALLGHSLYTSISSAVSNRLGTHIPAICGYFGVSLLGPYAVRQAVTTALQKTNLSEKQQSLLEPWLNMVGRLAIGFIPKVHATEEGIHYHYPSQEGYSQTVSSDHTATLKGDYLLVERQGIFDTAQGSFEGIYESEFKLGSINELSSERVRIQVIDKNGHAIPVVFTKKEGPYGPEVSVLSDNKDLERLWAHYFQPKSLVGYDNSPQDDCIRLHEGLSSKMELALDKAHTFRGIPQPLGSYRKSLSPKPTNYQALTSFSIIAGLLGAGKLKHSALTSAMAMLLTLSLSQNVEAGFLSALSPARLIGKMFAPFLNFGVDVTVDTDNAKRNAVAVLDHAGKKVEVAIQSVEKTANGLIVNLHEQGKLLISEAGGELQVLAEQIADHTQVTLKVGGSEMRCTIETGGMVAKGVVAKMGDEVRLTIQEAGNTAEVLMGKAEIHGDHMIMTFGEHGQLLIQKIGDTFEAVADKTLKKIYSGGKVTIGIAGEEIRLTLKTASDLGKELLQSTVHAGDSLVLNVISRAKNMLWGESRFEQMHRHTEARILESKIFDHPSNYQDSSQLLTDLLKDLQTNNPLDLTSLDKAKLYVQLMNHVNNRSPNPNKKWLYFMIAAVAYQDRRLNETTSYIGFYRKTTSYFNTTVIPSIPDDEIREAFLTNNFSALSKHFIDYVDQMKLFSDFASLPGVQQMNLPNVEVNLGQDIPVGSVIAYTSDIIPLGYVLCDGLSYSKAEYPELYSILRQRYGNDEGDSFFVPDYRGLFLRGISDLSDIGVFEEDSTRMPKKAFESLQAGSHSHETLSSGDHSHTVDLAGEHSHQIEEAGDHTHAMENAGIHQHSIKQSKSHKHKVLDGGIHEHEYDGYLLTKTVGEECGLAQSHMNGYNREARCNPENSKMKANLHPKRISNSPAHTHDMEEEGIHTHDMDQAGSHAHSLQPAGSHAHTVSQQPSHTHNIKNEGMHKHAMTQSEEHIHVITGGDEETRPKNKQVAYLIKAKPTVVKQVKELQAQIDQLRDHLDSRSMEGMMILNTLLVAVIGILAFRQGRPRRD